MDSSIHSNTLMFILYVAHVVLPISIQGKIRKLTKIDIVKGKLWTFYERIMVVGEHRGWKS
jgi:hypothetical protein